MQKILIVGTGGLAREFTAWFAADYEIVGYYSTNATQHAEFSLAGKHFSTAPKPESIGTQLAVIAIGDPNTKQKLFDELSELGFKFPTFVHHSCVVANSATLAAGVIIAPQCTIAPNVSIQTCSYINFNCGIGHETIIGSFTQINPGVQIAGAVTTGDCVLVGSGATILQGLHVGNHSKIASGAVVFSTVAENSTVIGNPAKRLRAFEQETA